MSWMNEYEIDEAVATIHDRLPHLLPYALYLRDWKDVVNRSSDGWPYWKPGSKCADKLSDLVEKAVQSVRGWGGREVATPSEAEFKKALTPIKSFATRKRLPAPHLRGT